MQLAAPPVAELIDLESLAQVSCRRVMVALVPRPVSSIVLWPNISRATLAIECPVNSEVLSIDAAVPGRRLLTQCGPIGDSPFPQTLAGEEANLDLSA